MSSWMEPRRPNSFQPIVMRMPPSKLSHPTLVLQTDPPTFSSASRITPQAGLLACSSPAIFLYWLLRISVPKRSRKSKMSYRIVLCLKYPRSEKGRDRVLCSAFFGTEILSSQYNNDLPLVTRTMEDYQDIPGLELYPLAA